jgi:hypothetical protein
MDVKEAIAALGGGVDVAKALGAKRSTVQMWSVRNSVPADRVVAFWDLCLARGVAWEPPGADAIRARLAPAGPAAKAEAA